MALSLTPIANLLDRGVGVQDIIAALQSVGTETELTFANDGNLILFVHISAAGPVVATLKSEPDPFGRGGGGVADEAISVPTGELGFFPFAASAMFNNSGIATVTLSVAANVSVGLYRLTKR